MNRLSGVFVVATCAISLAAFADTSLSIQGGPDSALRGTRLAYSGNQISCRALPFGGNYISAPIALVDYVRFLCDTVDGNHLDLQFSSGQPPSDLESWNHPLSIGFYERSGQALVQKFPHPGISIRSRELLQETPTGRFVVLAADYDYPIEGPQIARFAAAFQYTTDQHPIAPVMGTISYNFAPTSSIELSPSSVVGPASVTAVVRLAAPAPSEGAQVELLSSQPEIVNAPNTVTVSGGATDATVSLDVANVSENQDVDLLTVYNRAGSLATLHVLPVRPTITTMDFQADPGYQLLNGRFMANPDGVQVFTVTPDEQFLFLHYADAGRYWDFIIQAPAMMRLRAGKFSVPGDVSPSGDAKLWIGGTFNSPPYGNCNLNSGWFDFHDIVFDETTDPIQLKRLSMTFEHTCNVESPAKLRGTILYNEPPPARSRAVSHQ